MASRAAQADSGVTALTGMAASAASDARTADSEARLSRHPAGGPSPRPYQAAWTVRLRYHGAGWRGSIGSSRRSDAPSRNARPRR